MARKNPPRILGPGASPSAHPLRSEGQRLLLEVPGSQAEIAAQVGGPRSAPGFWRRGTKTPNAGARARLREAYGIDPRAWDHPPGARLPPEPAPASATAATTATADGLVVPSDVDPRVFYESTLADEGQPWDRRQRAAERLEQIRRRESPQDDVETRFGELRDHLARQRTERNERLVTPHGAAVELNDLAQRMRADHAALVRELAQRIAAGMEGP